MGDKPWDLSGGSYALDICSTRYAYDNFPFMDLRLKDDTWNSYDWDLQTGRGNFMWRWKECCTDGFVMSFFPNPSKQIYSYTLGARLAEIEGVYGGTHYIEFDPITARPVTHRIPSYMTAMEPFKGVQFKTLDCEVHCSRHTNCGEYSADVNCGWSLFQNSC